MRNKATAISLALVLIVAFVASAGTTGKIAGRVTDEQGNPLVGATVLVLDTSYGAMTDPNGEYFIINLQPGEYNLQARMVGMGSIEAQGIQVISDLTTRRDFSLSTTVEGITVITVTDQRGMILRDVTTSLHVVGRDEIKTMPVSGVQDVVSRQAGTINRGGLHFRGGRAGEQVFMVDGIAQMDPVGNWFTDDIPLSAITETSIISGGFGAEYGNAQSGVINIVTREGSSDYTGELMFTGNNWNSLGIGDPLGWSSLDFDTSATDETIFVPTGGGPFRESRLNLEGAIGGPEPLTSYLLPAMGVQIPGNMRIFASSEWLQIGGGEGGDGYWLNGWQEGWTFNGKLTYRINPRTKLNFSGFYQDTDWGGGGWQWIRYEIPWIDLDPESSTFGDTLAEGEEIMWGLPTEFRCNHRYSFALTQTMSDATFLEFKLNKYQSKRWYRIQDAEGGYIGEGFSFDDWLDYDQMNRIQDFDGFYRDGHSRRTWGDRVSTTYTARTDVTSQVSTQHQLKAGIEAKYFDIYDYSVDTASGGNIYMNRYHVFPNSGSAYIQDKMEYRGMIVNAGLRFDYFDPNFDDYPADPTNPVVPGTSPDDPDHIINPISVPVKYHLSPRVGFSHPITERDVLHFTYGHYFQTPRFQLMYYGSEYDLSGAFPLVGNANLEPEETVAYEVGVKHQFDDVTLLDITGFFKDITGLTATEKNFYSAVNSYDHYVNGDYGNVRGAELSLMRRPSNFWSVNMNYTYMVAKGKASGSGQNYTYLWAGWIIPRTESYLNWDQRHTVNFDFDYRIPRGEGPRLGDYPFLEGFGVHVSWRYGSGYPYSSDGQGSAMPIINGMRYPHTMTTDFVVNRMIWAGPITFNVFCEVYNLFDRRNINNIADIGWYDADLDGDGEPDHDPTGQLDNMTVYSRHRQIRFGLGLEW